MQLVTEMGDTKPSVRIRGWISSLYPQLPKISNRVPLCWCKISLDFHIIFVVKLNTAHIVVISLWTFVILLTHANLNVTCLQSIANPMQTILSTYKHANTHTRAFCFSLFLSQFTLTRADPLLSSVSRDHSHCLNFLLYLFCVCVHLYSSSTVLAKMSTLLRVQIICMYIHTYAMLTHLVYRNNLVQSMSI